MGLHPFKLFRRVGGPIVFGEIGRGGCDGNRPILLLFTARRVASVVKGVVCDKVLIPEPVGVHRSEEIKPNMLTCHRRCRRLVFHRKKRILNRGKNKFSVLDQVGERPAAWRGGL